MKTVLAAVAVLAAMLPITALAQSVSGPALTPERVFSDPGLSGRSRAALRCRQMGGS